MQGTTCRAVCQEEYYRYSPWAEEYLLIFFLRISWQIPGDQCNLLGENFSACWLWQKTKWLSDAEPGYLWESLQEEGEEKEENEEEGEKEEQTSEDSRL